MIEVPDEILVERCVGRRSDPVTGKIYHLKYNPPPNDQEILDRLVHRADDNEEAMTQRIATYHKNLSDIIAFFEPISEKFNGDQDKNKLSQEIDQFIQTPVEKKSKLVHRLII